MVRIGYIAFLLLPALVVAVPAGAGDRPPNLLLLTVDTLRPDRLGCYGNPEARTPNIDRIAREGLLVSEVVTRIPATIPSLASLMTSAAPHELGMFGNRDFIRAEEATLAEVLAAAGYHTEAVAYGVPSQGRGLEQGFQLYNGEPPIPGALPSVGFGVAEEVTAKVEGWFTGGIDRPFFGWIHYWDPHQDYSPPSPWAESFHADRTGLFRMVDFSKVFKQGTSLTGDQLRNSLALYDAEIAYVDREVGKVLELLERSGHAEQTIVVFAADHGEDFYEHHSYVGHGRFFYDAALRVPALLSGPGVTSGVHNTPVDMIDLAPTMVSLLGLDPPSSFRGGVFIGSGSTERPGGTFSLMENGSMLHRDGSWKLLVHQQTDTKELYNLESDPGEMHDLSDQEPRRLAAMEQKLTEWANAFTEDATAARNLPPAFEKKLKALGYID